MSEEVEVKITTEKELEGPFAKGAFYRNGLKSSKLTGIICAGLILFVLFAVFFVDSPEKNTNLSNPISTPEMITQDQGISTQIVPEAKTPTTQGHTNTIPSGTVKQFFGKPQLIMRPRLPGIPPGTMAKAILL